MIRAIVGANWGDEGKGKVTDMLASQSDIVVRFQGEPMPDTRLLMITAALRCICCRRACAIRIR